MKIIFYAVGILICCAIYFIPNLNWNNRIYRKSGKLLLFKGLGIVVETELGKSAALTFVSNRPFKITESWTLHEAVKQDDKDYKYALEFTTNPRCDYHKIFCKFGSCKLLFDQTQYALFRRLSTGLSFNLHFAMLIVSIFVLLGFLEVYHRFF